MFRTRCRNCKGEAPVDQCPVGGAPVAAKIGAIMGQEVKETARQVAFVKCAGTCDKTTVKYEYTGVEDCEMMAFIPGSGAKTVHLDVWASEAV